MPTLSRSMRTANASKATYERVSSHEGRKLTAGEMNKVENKLEKRGVSDAEKRFAKRTIADDKMTAAGRFTFRKFMADDGKPAVRTDAQVRFAAKVAAHSKSDSQLGARLSLLEVRRELAELEKNGVGKTDEAYARATYKGKSLSSAARREVNDFYRRAGG